MRRFIAVFLPLAVLFVAGCSQYQIVGKVVPGKVSGVVVVSDGDPRLERPGLADAIVSLTVDPNEMKPQTLPPGFSDTAGTFSIGTTSTGAGFLMYKLKVVCQRSGYTATVQTTAMPSMGEKLLIIMSPGNDTYRPTPDILQDSLRSGGMLGP